MPEVHPESRNTAWAWPILAAALAVAVLVVMSVVTSVSTEPFYGNDETRHVMTGVFFHDYFRDGDWTSPRAYAVRYYLQYPSLGLLVWPPLFYAIEGAAMLAFGPSLLVAKAVVLVFAAIAAVYLVALVTRTHDHWTACAAGLLFVLSPLILSYSRQVMLEMPALAFMLAATYHWLVHLERGRGIDLWLAAGASCAAVLTRFDAGVVLFTLLLMAALRGDWRVLARARTWLAASVSIAIVAPVIWLTATGVGAVHLSTIVPQSGPPGGAVAVLDALTYYLRSLPGQVGWAMLGPAFVGVVLSLRARPEWRASIPYIATAVSTYVMFTAISEKVPRHAIGWVPAVAALAALGLGALRRPGGASGLAWAAMLAVCVSTGVTSAHEQTPYVRGYARAADYVVRQTRASAFTLFDGYYDGNFIYQVRRLDPDRRLSVLRGDKVFYSSLINVGQQYTEHTKSDEEMGALLASYDPELVVVESPPVGGRWTPAARRLRRLLAAHPERYRLEQQFPVETTRSPAETVLLVYRSLVRNPAPRSSIEFDMLTLGGERLRAPDATER